MKRMAVGSGNREVSPRLVALFRLADSPLPTADEAPMNAPSKSST